MTEAYELRGEELQAYRAGFSDGNESHYAPGTYNRALTKIYDWGYGDGQKYGSRKGKPWSLRELIALNARKEP